MTIKKFLYFLAAPTLCFQLEYARTPKIRVWFLAKRTAELLLLCVAQVFILLQFLYPTLVKAPELFTLSNIRPFEIIAFVP